VSPAPPQFDHTHGHGHIRDQIHGTGLCAVSEPRTMGQIANDNRIIQQALVLDGSAHNLFASMEVPRSVSTARLTRLQDIVPLAAGKSPDGHPLRP